ncbi:hypothetical protein UAJ10_05235 [Nitrospirillum sp. BR 11164]|uniref:hypothetical protein n=1 Tax=Nitrospirillum sp. BR 11164 TaxID=3104324 RepID=UPI002AFDFD17|nr:hypothetical protein [Nitrospirillum sp. BR 11164]MEA1648415.1 hypothetical protein [Nitrospirillum sp. BR 11164]
MTQLQQVTGQLRRLGNSTIEQNSCTYSMMQVDDTILSGVVVPNVLDVFVQESHMRNTTLYVFRPSANKALVLAVRNASGKLYYSLPGAQPLAALIVFALLGCLAFGAGLLLLPLIFDVMRMNGLGRRFAADGGIEIAG